MAALSGKTQMCSANIVPIYPCGGDVLIVESNYDITNIHRGEFLKNCSLLNLSKCFL